MARTRRREIKRPVGETLQLQTLRHMVKAPSPQTGTGVFAKDLNLARGVSHRAKQWPVPPESG